MSFPRYPTYKESGVEWLGEVPAHWGVAPIKALVTLRSGGTPDKNNAAYWDGDVPWASAKDLKQDVLTDTQDHITCEAVAVGAATLVPAGSILVVVRGMILAHTFPVVTTAAPMAINQDLKAVTTSASMNANFLAWLLRGSSQETLRRLDEAGHGTKALRMDAWTSMSLPVPSASEQQVIASFLDRESATIDRLIAEQECLIELLAEKRQAVISHAVTKGRNPDAPMRQSGVNWLGDVPAHWSVWKLAHAFVVIGSGTTPNTERREYYGGEIPWVNTGDLNDRDLRSCKNRVTQQAVDAHPALRIYPSGSVAIAMYGATIGKLAVLCLPAAVNQACCVFAGSSVVRPRFLYYWLLAYRVRIVSMALGGGQPNVNQEMLRSLRVAVPDVTEQDHIVAWLDREQSAHVALVNEAECAIALLNERRAALISAAVTGKIDVRGLTT